MALYHKDIGLPAVKLPTGTQPLQYSPHALREAMLDRYTRYGAIDLPLTVDLDKATVIEVEVLGGVVTKVLYRARLDSNRDICFPVIPKKGFLFVKTVWVNLCSDKHKTLDRTKYDRP